MTLLRELRTPIPREPLGRARRFGRPMGHRSALALALHGRTFRRQVSATLPSCTTSPMMKGTVHRRIATGMFYNAMRCSGVRRAGG